MSKDVYNMLNDINIDLNELEKENFDEIEKKKIKKRFKKSFNKNGNNKLIAIDCSLALVVLTGFTNAGKEVIASVANLGISMFGIEEYLGIDGDIRDYKTIVNSAITHSGITIQLNEVI